MVVHHSLKCKYINQIRGLSLEVQLNLMELIERKLPLLDENCFFLASHLVYIVNCFIYLLTTYIITDHLQIPLVETARRIEEGHQ